MTVSRFFIDFLNAEIGLDVDSIGIMHVERAIDERLRATRLKVFRRGKLIAASPAANTALYLDDRPAATAYMGTNTRIF